MRPDPPSKSSTPPQEKSDPPSPAGPVAPAVRPKLQLQKRTVSEADPASPVSATSDAKASPFGGARPIDTFTREKEIEERRQLALRQKKEQEDKIREEKRQAKEAAKAEKAATAAAEEPKAKENGEEPPSVRSPTNFEVLSRADGENGTGLDGEADLEEVEDRNGDLVADKEVKPREIVRDITPEKTTENGNGNGVPEDTSGEDGPKPTAEALEGDGWSTVAKTRNSRRGVNQAARAIAS